MNTNPTPQPAGDAALGAAFRIVKRKFCDDFSTIEAASSAYATAARAHFGEYTNV